MSDSIGNLDELLAHSSWLSGLARHLVGEARAEDVVQEIWLRAAKRPPQRLKSPRGWLRSALRSVHLRGLERRTAALARERDTARSERLPSAAELAGRAEAQRLLVEAVLSLDEPYRRTLLLHFFEGNSTAEIANGCAVPESTVRTRLARGLERLRERLDASQGGRESWISGLVLLVAPERAGPPVAALTVGSLVVWKLVVAAISVVLLAWLGTHWFAGEGAPSPPKLDGVSEQRASIADSTPAEVEVTDHVELAPAMDREQVVVANSELTQEEQLPIEVAARRSPAVSGRVLDPEGRAVAGAMVYEGTLIQVALSLRNENNARRPSTTTDENGDYVLELETSGSVILSAWANEFAASEERTVDLPAAALVENVNHHLRTGATLAGIVYGFDFEPVANRRVQASCTAVGEYEVVQSGEDGSFEFRALIPGTWLVASYPSDDELEAAGEKSGGVEAMAHLAQCEVALEDSDHEVIALGLVAAESPHVTGVLQWNGAPTRGLMQWYPAARPNEKKVSIVEADGRFAIDLPEPGTWIVHANAQAKGLTSRGQRRTLELPPFAKPEIAIDLRGGSLVGRLLDQEGQAVAGVYLELRSVAVAPHQPDPTIGGGLARSASDGRFSFDLLLPGTYVAVVHGSRPDSERPHYGAVASKPVTLDGEAGGDTGDLILSDGVALKVKVQDSQGRPVSGASVYYHDADGHPLNPATATRTAGQGVADSPALPPGPVWVTALCDKGASSTVRVEVGVEESVELRLGNASWLEVTSSGKGVDSTRNHIAVVDSAGRRWGGLVDVRTLFSPKPERAHPERPLFGPLPDGVYTVRVDADGETKSAVVVLGPDAPLVTSAKVE